MRMSGFKFVLKWKVPYTKAAVVTKVSTLSAKSIKWCLRSSFGGFEALIILNKLLSTVRLSPNWRHRQCILISGYPRIQRQQCWFLSLTCPWNIPEIWDNRKQPPYQPIAQGGIHSLRTYLSMASSRLRTYLSSRFPRLWTCPSTLRT